MRREQEQEEVERRRAMPEEQRMKEDVERAQKLRDEKPKGQQKFLQKFWHKGAFHQVCGANHLCMYLLMISSRTKKSSNVTISLKQLNRLLTYLCYLKSCK